MTKLTVGSGWMGTAFRKLLRRRPMLSDQNGDVGSAHLQDGLSDPPLLGRKSVLTGAAAGLGLVAAYAIEVATDDPPPALNAAFVKEPTVAGVDAQVLTKDAASPGGVKWGAGGTGGGVTASALGVAIPSTLTYASLQASADAASAAGTRLWAAGTITTGSTLTITSDADLSGLTINYTGTGTAVVVGSTTVPTFSKDVVIGTVIATAKTTNGWAQVAGSIGVRVVNAYSYVVTLTRVRDFETGLSVYATNGNGTSYCAFHAGHLDNNKVNLRLGADNATSTWCNQITFYDGRYSHDSSEGVGVAGTRHILLDYLTNNNGSPNNNVWINPSLESPNVVEYVMDIQGGAHNQWVNPRLEYTTGACNIRWGAHATRNLITGGAQIDSIVETWVSGSGLNSVLGTESQRLMSSGDKGLVLENDAGSTQPAVSILRTGGTTSGDVPNTAYGTRLEYNVTRLKRYNDPYARVIIDGNDGRVYLGTGAAAPTAYLDATGFHP